MRSNSAMKIRKTHITLVPVAIMLFLFLAAWNVHECYGVGNVVRVNTIDFRGLNYLSKYEIIRNVPVKLEENAIIIDVDALERWLSSSRMVKSFRVVQKDDSIVVFVVENRPAYLVMLDKGDRLVPFELDESLNILSAGTVHAEDIPVVLISASDIFKNRFSERILEIFRIMRHLRANNVPLLAEITEIDCTDTSSIRVHLKGRRTVFTCHSKLKQFMTINYILGYLDRKGSYPEKILVDDRMAASW